MRKYDGMLIVVLLGLGLGGCGGGAELPAPLADGQPSGIDACDQYMKVACECTEVSPAAKATCDLKKESLNGWHAASQIPAQKAAAEQACTAAKMTLEALNCKKP